MAPKLTRAVKILLISMFVTFIVQQTADQFFGLGLAGVLSLVPGRVVINHWIWQLFTYPFVHSEILPLGLNLMMLAFFGGELEASWGMWRFLRYYFFCSVSAGLFYLFLQLFFSNGFSEPMFGASAAVYGLLMAYGLLFGERTMLFMMVFPMKAKHFVWVLAGIEFLSTLFSGHRSLQGAAQLGGMAAGFGFLWVQATYRIAMRKRLEMGPANKEKKKRAVNNHLKLVIDNKDNKGKRNSGDDDIDGNPKTWH